MITIQPATVADAALIAGLSRQTFYDTFAAYNTKEDMDKFMQEQFTHELLMKEVGAPGNTFLLARDGDTIAGYARLRENNIPPSIPVQNAMEISRLYAATAFIGKGVGAQLMEHSLQFAREKKKEAAWLGVWKQNERAIRFYQKWGFRIFGEHDFVLGNDVQQDWLMVKDL